MLKGKVGISFGEDALSVSNSTAPSTTSSMESSVPSTSSTSPCSSPKPNDEGPLINFFRQRSWFGFGAPVDEKKKQDKETCDEIIKLFRNGDVSKMEKYLENVSNDSSISTSNTNNDAFWWDDEDFAFYEQKASVKKESMKRKCTPHPKKGKLPPSVLKAVRFTLEDTPEDRMTRPFTPLFTSTPKHFGTDTNDDSDDEDSLPALKNCDSNTVLPPTNHNNTSSILLDNAVVMASLNKSRQETANAMVQPQNKNLYRIYYDDTDEEEVAEDIFPGKEIEPFKSTFVVKKSGSVSSVKTIQDQSLENFDTSTDSSVVLGLDCIENYIQRLDDEIAAANRYAREKDIARANGAIRHARLLQERFGTMIGAINDMCSRLPDFCNEDIISHGDQKNMSDVFEDSCWAARLSPDGGSFHEGVL